jgi:hypothetical protein
VSPGVTTQAPSRTRATATMWIGQTSATVLVAIQALVLIPIYLQRIDHELYGAWLGTGEVLTGILALDLGVSNLMVQRIAHAHGRSEKSAVAAWLGTGVTVLFGLGVVVLLVGLSVSRFLPAAFRLRGGEAQELVDAFRVGLVASGLLLVNGGFAAYFRAIQRPFHGAMGSILGTLAMFATTSVALIAVDAGLMAIPYGLVARAVVSTTYSLSAMVVVGSREGVGRPVFSREVFSESLRTMPTATAGGIGFIAAGQLDLTIVGLFLGPLPATTLMLTRKLADLARSFVDMVSFAVYGPFSHLVGSATNARAERVWSEIGRIHASVSVLGAVAFISGNLAFLSAWVPGGPSGGLLLTTLIGIQLLVASESFLRNVLYRAAGAIESGSAMLAAESAVRLVLVAVLVRHVGLAAVPIAAIAVGLAGSELYRRFLMRRLAVDVSPGASATTIAPLRKAAALTLATLVGALMPPSGWLVFAASVALGVGMSILVVTLGNAGLIALVRERALSLLQGRDTA